MSDVLLFVKDFELGTKISESLINLGTSVSFAEGDHMGLNQVDENTKVVILDLDDLVFSTISFINSLRRTNINMKIAGYMKYVHKESYERLKAAGCDIILPKTSFVKNIHTLVAKDQ